MHSKHISLVISGCVLLLGSLALWQGTDGLQSFTAETARRNIFQASSQPLHPVLVENQSGITRSFGSPNERYQVVDFIYTRCPSICQTMAVGMAQLQTALKQRGLSDQVELLSISFDSMHESPLTLSAYLARYEADTDIWQGYRLVDSEAEKQILREFDVTVVPDQYGGFVHNAAFFIVKSNAIIGIFDYTDTASILSLLSSRLNPS